MALHFLGRVLGSRWIRAPEARLAYILCIAIKEISPGDLFAELLGVYESVSAVHEFTNPKILWFL